MRLVHDARAALHRVSRKIRASPAAPLTSTLPVMQDVSDPARLRLTRARGWFSS